MPASGTPWSPTFDFGGDPTPQSLINAQALQGQFQLLAAYLGSLDSSLQSVIRPDDTLTDELVRIRNLHPELDEWLTSLINGQVAAQALSWLYPVRVASLTNIAALSGLPIVDGVQLVEGDRVLLLGQTNPTTNGVWIATNVGPAVWVRPYDFAQGRQITQPEAIIVREGATSAETAWAVVTGMSVQSDLSAQAPIIDTDNLTFFPVWGPFPLPVAKGGTGATTPAGARASLGCPGVEAFDLTGDAVQSTFTVTHTLGTEDIVWSLKDATTKQAVGAEITVSNATSVVVQFTFPPAAGQVHRLVLIG